MKIIAIENKATEERNDVGMEIKASPIKENEEFLTHILDQYQIQQMGVGENKKKEYSFAVVEGEDQIAGMTGRRYGNTLHLSLLAVSEEYRKNGLGKMLINKLEEIAVAEHIKHLTVSTQDYQALDFYKKNGFNVFGKLKNAPFEGTTKYYLEKVLRE